MKLLVQFVFLAVAAIYSSYAYPAEEREKREIAMAENAILWSLVAGSSDTNRRACFENKFACSDDRAELGLLLLGNKTSLPATNALVSLLRFRLDGSLASDFKCFVVRRRKAAKSILAKLNSKTLRTRCIAEKSAASSIYPYLKVELEPESVCAKENDIEALRHELLFHLKKRTMCEFE